MKRPGGLAPSRNAGVSVRGGAGDGRAARQRTDYPGITGQPRRGGPPVCRAARRVVGDSGMPGNPTGRGGPPVCRAARRVVGDSGMPGNPAGTARRVVGDSGMPGNPTGRGGPPVCRAGRRVVGNSGMPGNAAGAARRVVGDSGITGPSGRAARRYAGRAAESSGIAVCRAARPGGIAASYGRRWNGGIATRHPRRRRRPRTAGRRPAAGQSPARPARPAGNGGWRRGKGRFR